MQYNFDRISTCDVSGPNSSCASADLHQARFIVHLKLTAVLNVDSEINSILSCITPTIFPDSDSVKATIFVYFIDISGSLGLYAKPPSWSRREYSRSTFIAASTGWCARP